MADAPAYINVGIIPTVTETQSEHLERGTGRIITFPNWVQVGGYLPLCATLVC
jgi:hypothetical protein